MPGPNMPLTDCSRSPLRRSSSGAPLPAESAWHCMPSPRHPCRALEGRQQWHKYLHWCRMPLRTSGASVLHAVSGVRLPSSVPRTCGSTRRISPPCNPPRRRAATQKAASWTCSQGICIPIRCQTWSRQHGPNRETVVEASLPVVLSPTCKSKTVPITHISYVWHRACNRGEYTPYIMADPLTPRRRGEPLT